MSKKTEIFILTFDKEITQNYDKILYKPLVCGADIVKNNPHYLKDNTGDNISNLNNYYTELTGEYWVWKNTTQDIVGFCHYRRWYVKNLKWEKITKEDIITDLDDYDIILPKKIKYSKPYHEVIEKTRKAFSYGDIGNGNEILKEIFKNDYPEYEKFYYDFLNNNYIYPNNIFIANRQFAEDYFMWLFEFLEKFRKEINFDKNNEMHHRIGGFVSERLFNTYILKNNLKIKEYDIYCSELRMPLKHPLISRFPLIGDLEYELFKFIQKIKKII